jgi:hypothetical protein
MKPAVAQAAEWWQGAVLISWDYRFAHHVWLEGSLTIYIYTLYIPYLTRKVPMSNLLMYKNTERYDGAYPEFTTCKH